GDGHRLAHLARPVERREQRPIVGREWGHLPGPMSYSAAMYHTGKNPLRPVKRDSEEVATVKTPQERRLHKAFLRYHDPANHPRYLKRERARQARVLARLSRAPERSRSARSPARWTKCTEAYGPSRRRGSAEGAVNVRGYLSTGAQRKRSQNPRSAGVLVC